MTFKALAENSRKIFGFLGLAVLFLIVASDLLAAKSAFFGKTGVIFWFCSYLLILIFTAGCLAGVIRNSVMQKSFFTVFMIGFWIYQVAVNTALPSSVNGEATQEVACTVNHFSRSEDWGFRKTCLFGYPARGFFLHAFPTVIFGRSLLALNTGGSAIFVIAIIIFSYSIMAFLKKTKNADLYSAFFLALIMHVYFLNHFLFSPEHSMFPFSYTLILTGLLLLFSAKPENHLLPLIGFTLLYLVFSYTTGLSVALGSLLVLPSLAFSKNLRSQQRLKLAFIAVMILVSFVSSLYFRQDIKAPNTDIKAPYELGKETLQAFKHIIFPPESEYFLSPFITPMFLLVVSASLFLIFGWKAWVISWWMIMVIAASVVFQGYSYYAIPFRMHRAMLVIPVFSAIAVFIIKKINTRIEIRLRHLFILFAVTFLTGLFYQDKMLDAKAIHPHYYFNVWMKENIPAGKHPENKTRVYFIGDSGKNYISMNDTLAYFNPDLRIEGFDQKECDPLGNRKGYIVSRAGDRCESLLSVPGFVDRGIFEYKSDVLRIFEKADNPYGQSDVQ